MSYIHGSNKIDTFALEEKVNLSELLAVMNSPNSDISTKSNRQSNIKAIAQYKIKKMAQEDEKKRELMKKYPKLFSPEKVKQLHKKRADLLPPSLKNELSVDNSENIENVHHNIRQDKTQMTPKGSKTIVVDEELESAAVETQESFHCIFDFESEETPPPSTNKKSSVHHRASSMCRCGRPSGGNRRSSVMSVISTDTYEHDDKGDDGEDCDICQSLAARKASRTHLMQTLRHFLRDEQSCSAPIAESPEHDEKGENERVEKKTEDMVPLVHAQNISAAGGSTEGVEVGPLCTEVSPRERSAASVGSNSSFGIMRSESSDDLKDMTLLKGGFYDVLEKALMQGRIVTSVYGFQVKESFAQFLVLVQVMDSSNVEAPACAMEMVLLRRFSQFSFLQRHLASNAISSNAKIPALPKKQLFPNLGARWKDPAFLKKRQLELDEWLTSTLKVLVRHSCMGQVVQLFSNFMSANCA